jgi:hypothetical protein
MLDATGQETRRACQASTHSPATPSLREPNAVGQLERGERMRSYPHTVRFLAENS